MKSFLKNVLTTVVGVMVALLIFAILIPVVVMMISRAMQSEPDSIQNKSVLHVRVKGSFEEHSRPFDFDILAGHTPFSRDARSLPLYETIAGIEAAKTDKRIQGMYVDIRDFDSGWAGVTELHDAIKKFAESGKWVYAYADSFDEKSYYLATAAEKIFMPPSGEMELNGLSVSEAFLKGLFDKLEVQPRIFRVGKFKAAIEPLILNKMSDANRLQNKTLLDDVWSVAKKEIARFAGEKPDSIDEAAGDLRIRSAEDAADNGFISQLMYEDQLIDVMKAATVGKDEDIRLVNPVRLLREDQKSGGKNKIAIIFAQGEITGGVGSRETIGEEGIVADLDDASHDEDVKAIVVRINSPGGDALAADVIWEKMKNIDKKIPVVVSMGDVAASGGYYMAAGARYVVAEPTTITGSIGVFGVMFDTEKFFKNKLAVAWDQVGTHQYSDLGNMNRPMSETEQKVIQDSVNRVYGRFLKVVKDGREFKEQSKVEELAEGRVWSGVRAKDLGLVDELGGLGLAIEKATQIAKIKTPGIEIYPRNDDPLSLFLERFTSESMQLMVPSWLQQLGVKFGSVANKLNVKPGAYARMLYDLDIR